METTDFIDKEDMFICPECGSRIDYDDFTFTDRYLVLCPKCGIERHLNDFKECNKTID